MREIFASIGVAGASLLAQAAQNIPTDASSIEQMVKSGGVIGVLCLVIGALLYDRRDTKKEHKDALAVKDLKIDELETKIDNLEARLNESLVETRELRRHVLQITPPDIDVSATVRRSKLKLKEREENDA